MKFHILFILFAGLFLGCTSKQENVNIVAKEVIITEDAEELAVNVKLIRVDQMLYNAKSAEELSAILVSNPAFFKQYLKSKVDKPLPEDAKRLFDFYNTPALKDFYKDINAKYGKMEDEQKQLNELFKYTKYHFKDFKIPTVTTIYSGLMEPDMAFSDSSIVICLDWFMGPKAKYQPNIYDYMKVRYDKPYVIPMMALGVSTKFIEEDEADKTMLAEMIYYGKAHYFVERVMPHLEDSLNIGYTGKAIQQIDHNMPIIWSHFIEHQLLFSTSRKSIENYVNEAPFVNEISNDCPGRIGRWLGWQIVRKYMQTHPDVTLEMLMKEKNAQKIFKESGFKPPIKK